MNISVARGRALLFLSIGALAVPIAAHAQTDPQPSNPPTSADVGHSTKPVAAADGDIVVTARRFLSDVTVSSTKIAQRVAETPQPISVLDAKIFKDLGLKKNFTEALNIIPGVNFENSYGSYLYVSSRGYDSTFRVNGSRYGQARVLDSVAIDRIEFVRGGTGATYGQGGPGGILNIITKKPQATLGGRGSVQGGSFGFARGEALLTGPINASGTIRGLIAGSYDRDGSQFDGEHRQNYSVFGALDIDFTDRLTLSTIGYYNNQQIKGLMNGYPLVVERNGPTDPESGERAISGVTFPYDLPVRSGTAIPWARDNQNIKYFSGDLKYSISPAFNIDLLASRSVILYRQIMLDLCCEATPEYITSAHTYFQDGGNNKETNVELRLGGDVQYLGMRTQYLLSGQYEKGTTELAGSDYLSVDDLYDLRVRRQDYANPFAGLALDQFITNAFRVNRSAKSLSLVTVNHINDRLAITLGGRFDRSQTDLKYYDDNYKTVTSSDSFNSNKFSKRAAIDYEILKGLRIYYSYDESFLNNIGRTCSGRVIPPETGTTNEIGIKKELNGGKLLLSASIYEIKTKGNVVNLPIDTCPSVILEPVAAGNGSRSKGGELELSGQITPSWNIFAGYAYTDASVAYDDGGYYVAPNVPRHQISLYTIYDFLGGRLKGFGIGGGFLYLSSRLTDEIDKANAFDRFVIPKQFRVSGALYYRPTKDLSFAFNIKNLFNSCDVRAQQICCQNFYLEPRTFLLSADVGF